MDTARDLSQIGQENPCVPISPSEDALFHSFFDWQSYCESTKPASPYHSPASPSELSKLITEIPEFIDNLSLGRIDRDFLDTMKAKATFGPEEEVATTSDYSGQTPPELIRGGSTSPSDHSGSVLFDRVVVEDSRSHPSVSLREVQAQDDEWTYPQTGKQTPSGYPPRLQVPEDLFRRAADKGTGLKRRRSSNGLDKRQRQLVDPDQTADVRKSGACLPCRVTKTRCQDSGVCPACRRLFPEHSHVVCTRMTPAMTWPVIGGMPDVWSVNATEEEQFRFDPRFFTGKAREIFVFFPQSTASPGLRAIVQAYRSQDGAEENPRKAAFPRERVPSHYELQKWSERQIQNDKGSDFRHSLQNFLLAYAQEGYGLPKYNLVEKVHRMNCFFKIWKTPSFSCRDPSGKLAGLPMSVQSELRLIAREALKSLEHDVFKILDDCIAQQGALKEQEKIAVWASMWQLMLMYRDLLEAFQMHLERMKETGNETALSTRKTQYRVLIDKAFPVMIVFYHYLFRSAKSLQMSLDWLKSPRYPTQACHSNQIRYFGRELIDSRRQMLEQIRNSTHEIDRMLCVYVVNHEHKKLTTKRRVPKGSKKSQGNARRADDDCEDDAE